MKDPYGQSSHARHPAARLPSPGSLLAPPCHPSWGSMEDGTGGSLCRQTAAPSRPCPQVPAGAIADTWELPARGSSLPFVSQGGSGEHLAVHPTSHPSHSSHPSIPAMHPTRASHCTSQGHFAGCLGAVLHSVPQPWLVTEGKSLGLPSERSLGRRWLRWLPRGPKQQVTLWPGAGQCLGQAALRLSCCHLGLQDAVCIF